tara:strand:+ start:697 stop:1245 length:549 start_codon:yes stop_codon:yes gene_type:complete
MIKQVAAIRYAKAYFAHCQKTNSLKEVVIESENLIEILSHNSNLNSILKNKTVPNQTKKKIIFKICGEVSEYLKTLIEMLVRKNRLNIFNDILNQFIELYKINSGIETCYLISAEKTSSKIEENLRHFIKKITKNKIKIINTIDKDLIGGFILKVGDIQFDNSVSSTLNKLKRTLKRENTFI